VLYCIPALYHDRNTVDWTGWRHEITAQTGPTPRSCIGPRAQILHWAPQPARAGPVWQPLAYEGGALCHAPPQTLKIKNVQTVSGSGVTVEGQGPQFKINRLCFLVTDIRTTQTFLWLLYVSSAWFSFYDFILSLTKWLHTCLLSNLTQVTMNTRKKLRLTWDLSPQTSKRVFYKRFMFKTYNIQARI